MKKFFIITILIFLTGCSSSVPFYDEYTASKYETEPYEYSEHNMREQYVEQFSYAEVKKLEENMHGGIVGRDPNGHTASLFATVQKENPSTVVFLTATSTTSSEQHVLTHIKHYETQDGKAIMHEPLVKTLRDRGLVKIIEDDSATYAFVPYFAKYLNNKMILPLTIEADMADEQMEMFIKELRELLPDDTVVIASMNFSQDLSYQTALFHDALSEYVISAFDYDRIETLDMDTYNPLRMTMKLLETFQSLYVDNIEHSYTSLPHDEFSFEPVTGYITAYISRGEPDHTRMASMLNVGDIMLDRNVKNQIDAFGTDHVLGELAGEDLRFFHGMDVVSGNLEGPFANFRRETTKSIAFRFDPVLLPMLKKYNFSLFTLANNHTLDMSRAGFAEAKVNLKNAGFEYYGDQFNITDESVITKEVGGLKFAYVGINDTHFSIDIDDMVSLVVAQEENHDHTIVNIHWGEEYAELDSNTRQQEIAHRLIDAGADVIIGHHPHVIQEMEIYKDRPIFYSLGNFVFDQYFSIPTQQTLAIGTVFHDVDAVTLYVIPIEAQKSRNKLMNNDTADELMTRFVKASRLDGFDIDMNTYSVTVPLKNTTQL